MSQSRNFFDDSPPLKDFWMLFKVSTYERLLQMQKGLLYMNSLDYFSNFTGEESLPLRTDELESIYGILRAGTNGQGYSVLSVKIEGSGKEIDLGTKAVLTARFSRPKNYMLFCMSSFADGPDGRISGENEGALSRQALPSLRFASPLDFKSSCFQRSHLKGNLEREGNL